MPPGFADIRFRSADFPVQSEAKGRKDGGLYPFQSHIACHTAKESAAIGPPAWLGRQALAVQGRQRRIVLTVSQFFTAGRVVSRSDLRVVLPDSFVEATGYRAEILICELPLVLDPVHVKASGACRRDADPDPAHRWLREQVRAVAAG